MRFKRLVIVLTILNILFVSLTTSVRVDAAYSKGVTIAAKKAAKEIAKDAAVEMANQIVSEFLVRELLEGVNTDPDYAPVCMDGAKQKLEDCAPDKRAQVKKLNSADKKVLEKKVETVLERKTGTSSKWAKFIDWFVPMFLAAGLIEFISSAINDSDILSFFDEIAQEALIEAGFLQPLLQQFDTSTEILDFSKHVSSVEFAVVEEGTFDYEYRMTVLLKPNTSFAYTHKTIHGVRKREVTAGFSTQMRVARSYVRVGSTYFAMVNVGSVQMFDGTYYSSESASLEIFRGTTPYKKYQDATVEAGSYIKSNIANKFIGVNDINAAMNAYINTMNINSSIQWQFSNLTTVKPTRPVINTNYGTQTSIEKLKDQDGNYKFKGIDSFDFKDGDKKVYPSKDSTTGWKDKETHEDVTVNEDNITVNDKTETDDKEDEEEDPGGKCSRDFKKIRFDKVGTAFTNAFPFSIPWDIKRFFDSTFAGVGDEKPSVNLSFLGPNVTMTVPDLIDSWMPYLRNFLLISFDLAIIYMFYRFMRGGGD